MALSKKIPSNIVGAIYSSHMFTWDAETRTFHGDFSKVPKVLRALRQDDMLLGFAIRSHRTGNLVYFVLESMQTDPETAKSLNWVFEAENLDDLPGLNGVTAVIRNDL